MDIKIEFSARDKDILRMDPEKAHVELKDGRDAILRWNVCTANTDAKDLTATVLCSGAVLGFKDGTEAKASWDMLSGAKVLAFVFEKDELPRTGLRLSVTDTARGVALPLYSYSMDHPSRVPWPELDRNARPMVRYFNNSGLPTSLCCSGHPGTEQKRFWVEFRADVTDADIARFMESHTAPGTGFTANGMFCARYDKESGYGIVKSLQYTATDTLAAMQDLSDWVADGMSGRPGHGAQSHGYDREARAAGMCVSNMDPATADALYRAVWFDRVVQDIHTWMEDNDEEGLPQDVIDLAAGKYVYDGEYDCNRDYWSNIGHVVELAKGIG